MGLARIRQGTRYRKRLTLLILLQNCGMDSGQRFNVRASADADETAPQRSEPRGSQNEKRVVTERAAVLAHGNADRTDLMTACRIKQA